MQDLRKLHWSFFAAIALTFAVPVTWAQGYIRADLLIETEELAKLLDQPNVRIIDAVDPGTYGRAHVPGAVNIFYVTLADIESRKENGYPLSIEDAEKIFGDAGIGNNTQVVVYDGGEGPFASGVWFVLEFFGHKNVKILNGGFRKWMAEHRPVTQNDPKAEKKKFVANPNADKVVTLKWLKKNLRNKNIVIVDNRSFKEYIGEDVRPGASRGGHIPGAVHIEWKKFSDKMNTFKSSEQLEKVLTQRGITKEIKVVTYCQTGVGRSTDMALAMKLIGYDNVVEYTGSWQEWSSDPRLPIEK